MLSCALCGRPMDQAAVMIGNLPVGPKCAQRAGLLPLAKRKRGLVVQLFSRRRARPADPKTMELFPGA